MEEENRTWAIMSGRDQSIPGSGKNINIGLNSTCVRNGVLIEVRKRRNGKHCILCTGVTGTDPKCQVPGQAHTWILLIGRLVGDFNNTRA